MSQVPSGVDLNPICATSSGFSRWHFCFYLARASTGPLFLRQFGKKGIRRLGLFARVGRDVLLAMSVHCVKLKSTSVELTEISVPSS